MYILHLCPGRQNKRKKVLIVSLNVLHNVLFGYFVWGLLRLVRFFSKIFLSKIFFSKIFLVL